MVPTGRYYAVIDSQDDIDRVGQFQVTASLLLGQIAVDDAGVLNIDGTAQNDTIIVSREKGRVIVNKDGLVVADLNGSSIQRIEFRGRAGDDYFRNDTNLPSTAWGGKDQDTLIGGTNVDIFYGGAGRDNLRGRGGDDQLFGEGGSDLLIGNAGSDLLDPGPGSNQRVSAGNKPGDRDVFIQPSNWSGVVTGRVEWRSASASQTLSSHLYAIVNQPGSMVIVGSPGASKYVAQVKGTDLVVTVGSEEVGRELVSKTATLIFVGTSSVDQFENRTNVPLRADGLAGDDVIWGGAASDTIYGGDGMDLLFGGSGDDMIYGGGGNDTIEGGSGADWIDGGDGRDILYGNAGDDTLLGGGGNDELFGGPGIDLIDGQEGDNRLDGYQDHWWQKKSKKFRGWIRQ